MWFTEQPPWEFGLATLGSKLVSAKRIIEPATLTYPIANAGGGEEPVPEDEAASDPQVLQRSLMKLRWMNLQRMPHELGLQLRGRELKRLQRL